MSMLQLPKETKYIKKGTKTLVFNPTVPSWIVTNDNGKRILKFCNGKRDKEKVIRDFCCKFGSELEETVREFLSESIEARIFETRVTKEVAKTSGYKLRILQLSLTSACNLNCSYCYATARRENGNRRLTTPDYQRVIDEAKTLSDGLDVVLTGGEPLLNNDCFAIAQYAKELGCNLQLLTNGTLLNADNINDIAQLFSLVKVSVDGSTKELHEKHRGLGSYVPVTAAIDLMDSAGVNYSISMTVNKQNISDIPAMAGKYGSRLTFAPLFLAGNAKNNGSEISGLEYYEALSRVDGVNPLAYCESSLEQAQKSPILKCAIGDAELSVSTTGDVYPCQLLHEPQFLVGNILDTPLVEIYSNSDVVRKCRELTVDRIRGCSTCFLRYVCGGACRARAFYECGDACVSGNFCEYEKTAFTEGIFALYSQNALAH